MNPLARGVHKNLNSRKTSTYNRMANDLDNGKAEESLQQQQPGGGRARLGGRLKNSSMKLVPSSKYSKTNGGKHHLHPSGKYEYAHEYEHEHERETLPESSWTGESPTEFSVMQQRRQQQQQNKRRPSFDSSVLTSGASAGTNEESIDAAGGPTITKPAPQHHTLMSMPSSALAAPALGAGNTVCSSATFESHDQVEKPSITSPSIHQWTAARNCMGGARKMLSEKTINTINTIDTKGTINTYATTGTGTHTAATDDSTLRSSIISLCTNKTACLNAPLMDLVPDSPLMRRQQHQDQDDDDDHGDMSINDIAASPRPMGENDEDRMMRLAMEMSLREFEEQQEHRTSIAMPLYQQKHQQQQRSTAKHQERYPQHHHAEESSSAQQKHHQAAPVDSLLMTRPTPPPKEEVQVRDRLTEFYRQSSQNSLLTSATGEEATEVLVENPHFAVRGQRTITLAQSGSLETSGSDHSGQNNSSSHNPSMVRQLEAARAHLSKEEADEIESALRDSGDIILPSRHIQSTSALPSSHDDQHPTSNNKMHLPPQSVSLYCNNELSAASDQQSGLAARTAAHLSTTEAEEIQRAIREADERENQRSIKVALQLQAEEDVQYETSSQQGSNNRHMPAIGEATPPLEGAHRSSSSTRTHATDLTTSSAMYDDYHFPTGLQRDHNRGWHSNGNVDSFQPHQDEQATAVSEKLSFDCDADEDLAFVGHTAYNTFKTATDRQNSHGEGINRADKPELDKKKALDRRVQLQISRAVKIGLIEKCNGIVKDGSEAVVYHAEKGEHSDGHDVAIKVFKRIKEFRGRGGYQEGDPRYIGLSFRDNGSQEQLELWAEKEYRNVIRANRARVPVASPLMHRDNIVFMRFMGKDGWPSPQLKELEVRTGSKTWTLLYSQIMVAVRRLYVTARLVHGDLSEYNILVCPADLVENKDNVALAGEDGKAIQAVLIDFGQAVDVHHPSAKELLVHDLSKIRRFFSKKGTKTLGSKMALDFVTKPEPYEGEQPKAKSISPAEDFKQPGLMVSTNSFSTKSSRSTGTSEKVDAPKRPGRMVSVNSSSTRSSGRSSAASEDVNGQQPSRMVSVASTQSTSSNGTQIHSLEGEPADAAAKVAKKGKKKEKKLKKESKKKKKDKKEFSSSSAKRKTKLVEPITQTPPANVDEQLFILNGVPPSNMFGDLGGDVDWEAEWNEEFSVKNAPSSSS